MFAVVRTGGKQYRVAPGDKIVVEKLDGNAGDKITLGDVLLAGEGSNLKSTNGLTVAAAIGDHKHVPSKAEGEDKKPAAKTGAKPMPTPETEATPKLEVARPAESRE